MNNLTGNIQFVASEVKLEKVLNSLKFMACPHCGGRGFLNRHDWVYGNSPDCAAERVCRGRRAYCSNSNGRGGCGKTISFLFGWIVPKHSWDCSSLDRIFESLRGGSSVQEAWQGGGCGLSLSGLYHLLQRLRRQTDRLRTWLCGCCDPPESISCDYLYETLLHLKMAFPTAGVSSVEFQMRFQTTLIG